jgi:hypothetical protein
MTPTQQSWVAHCKNRYPREFAHPKRLPFAIRNDDVLISTIERWSLDQPCYITVYAFEDWHIRPSTAIIDRVYIDLDHHTNPQNAVDDAIRLIEGLQRFDIQTTQYFSGKKGIAVYIDFEPVQIAPQNKKGVVAAFQRLIGRKFGLTTVDSSSVGDINRVSRLPNTKHQDAGLYCVPVTMDELKEGLNHIKHLARKPRTDLPATIQNSAVMPGYLRRIEHQIVRDREKRKIIDRLNRLERAVHPPSPDRGGGGSREENIANKLMHDLSSGGHLSRKQKIGLIYLLDDLNWSSAQIVNMLLSNAAHPDRSYTTYQVSHIINWKRRQVSA